MTSDNSFTYTPEPSPPNPATRLGTRLKIDTHVGTIKYIGPVPADNSTENAPIWYGIEWDDPSRGKHNGEHQGVSYFTVSVPGSGSFVKAIPTKSSATYIFGRSFLEALLEKYTEGLLTEDVSNTNGSADDLFFGGDKKIQVKTYGWEKIERKQKQVSNLKEVGLKDMDISLGNDVEDIQRICPSIVDLDLSKNVISDWMQVARICKGLPSLELLRLAFTRFIPVLECLGGPERPHDDLFSAGFGHIKTLVLNNTFLEWDQVEALEPFMPALESLHFGFNRLTSFGKNHHVGDTSSTIQGFRNLQTLYLEGNLLTSWSQIHYLSSLPSLSSLSLNQNQITNVTYDGGFTQLKTLNLTANEVNDWYSVNALNVFPSLVELRFRGNPVLDHKYGSTATPVGSQIQLNETANATGYSTLVVLIGRLGKMSSINGSTIPDKDRIDGERYYLKEVAKEEDNIFHSRVVVPDSGVAVILSDEERKLKEEFVRLHPRYAELVSKHGAVAVAKEITTLADRMLNLSIRCPSCKIVSKRHVPSKKLPGTMIIRNAKTVLARLFGVPVHSVVLKGVYKSSGATEDSDRRATNADGEMMVVTMDDELRELTFYGLESGDEVVVEVQ